MHKKDNKGEEIYNSFIKKGINYIKNDNIQNAKLVFLDALKLNQKKYEAYINLSNIYLLQKKASKSTSVLFKYLSINKFNLNILNHLGKICLNYNISKDQKKYCRFLEEIKLDTKSEYKFIFYFLGIFYENSENFDRSISSYSNSILCDKNNIDPYLKLLNLLEKTNNLDQLKIHINLGLKNFTTKKTKIIFILYRSIYLNRIKNFKLSESLINKHKLFSSLKNNDSLFLKLIDLQARNCEKLGKYSEAFTKFQLRNKILINQKENQIFDRNRILQTIQNYKIFYHKKNIEFLNNKFKFDDDINLVFLVGFPRSGTTLLDTILRTHSKIKVLEEKPFLLNLRHKFFNDNRNDLMSLKKITYKEITNIRQNYFKLINYTKDKVIIDKLPLSIIELGFIKVIFPNAKIILALRHPCDTTLSCFFSFFKINDAMINFLNWEDTLHFYDSVFDLFNFYESELGFKYISIKYENVVKDFKEEITKLLNYLGLNYEKGIEDFHKTAKLRSKINTPSYTQVINPIYSSSVGKWKKYKKVKNSEKYLKKWINYFNY